MRKSRLVKKTASKKRFSGKSRLAILATAVAALALAIVSLTAGTEVSAQSAQGKAKKFKATRAFVVDKQSGEVRLPTQEEVDQVVQELTTFGQKPAESLQQPTAQANGAVVIDFGTAASGGDRAGAARRRTARSRRAVSSPSKRARRSSAWSKTARCSRGDTP